MPDVGHVGIFGAGIGSTVDFQLSMIEYSQTADDLLSRQEFLMRLSVILAT